MAKELIIPFSERIPKSGKTQRFSFLDNEGKFIPLHKLFGRTTTWPDWAYGLTRQINGETWWIIQATSITKTGEQEEYLHIDKNNKIIGTVKTYTMPIHLVTKRDERALIHITQKEAETLGHKHQDMALAVKEGTDAWNIFLGTLQDKRLPITHSIKQIDDAINTYLAKETINSPTQPKKGIQKITNYTPVKAMNKINEIIEYINKHD